jgi:hypothetical protein
VGANQRVLAAGAGHDGEDLQRTRWEVGVLTVVQREPEVGVAAGADRLRPGLVLEVGVGRGVRADLVQDAQHPEHRRVHQGGLGGVAEDRADVLLAGPAVQPGVLDQAVDGIGDVAVAFAAEHPALVLERGVAEHVQG